MAKLPRVLGGSGSDAPENEPGPAPTQSPPPPPTDPNIIQSAGEASSAEDDAKAKQERDPLKARPVDTIMPRTADASLAPATEQAEAIRASNEKNRAVRELSELPGTRTGEQGPEPDQPKDETPMPTGGPRDPAVTAGRERRRQISFNEAFPAVGPDNSAERERRLIPTGVAVEVGPRVLPQVEDAVVVVLQRSFINNVERERGDLVHHYTGGLGKNLRAATPEEVAAGQASV